MLGFRGTEQTVTRMSENIDTGTPCKRC